MDSYMASGSEPGKSVRPQPSRKSVSPATRRPSTRKHWLPGVCPGVWIISTATCPTCTTSPLWCADQVGPTDAGRALHPGHLFGLDVDRHLHLLEQGADPLERPPAHLPAEVIRVEVGPQDAGQPHAVGRQDVEQVLHRVGGVDRHRLAGLAVADEVDEVDHLAGHHVALGEVATGQQLAEIQAVVAADTVTHRRSLPRRWPATLPASASSRGTSSSTWAWVRRRR